MNLNFFERNGFPFPSPSFYLRFTHTPEYAQKQPKSRVIADKSEASPKQINKAVKWTYGS
jgi:hypothetical protein